VLRAINIENGAFERQDNQRYSPNQFSGAGTDFDPQRSGTVMRDFDSFCSAALIAAGPHAKQALSFIRQNAIAMTASHVS
jgi:hypothetical protein